MIKLKILLEEILKEVGDLNNIKSHNWEKISKTHYNFEDKTGNKVEVDFQLYDEFLIDKINKLNYNLLKVNKSYNVLYRVKGKQSQAYISDYSILISILKTVVEIIKDFIINNNVEVLTLYAANKDENKVLDLTDPQKENLYKIILIKNIKHIPGWSFTEVETSKDFKGIILHKK